MGYGWTRWRVIGGILLAVGCAAVARPGVIPDDARYLEFPDAGLRVALWTAETAADGEQSCYAILGDSAAGGEVLRVARPSHLVRLRGGAFDPLHSIPEVTPALAAGPDTRLCIVQFVTQPLVPYRTALTRAGGTIRHFLPDSAYIVQMDADARERVAALPFVRWVGPYHPAHRLPAGLASAVCARDENLPAAPYNLLLLDRSAAAKRRVAERVEQLGGVVQQRAPRSIRMVATLTGPQLRAVVRLDEIGFVDPWGPLEPDMNLVREITGANYIESVAGYTGVGVRGEVFDAGVLDTHCDFQSNPIVFHTPNCTWSINHGTAVMGIAFGDGTCNPNARGMLPDGQPIYACWSEVADRATHTLELVDPAGPYRAVFQTASVGSPRTQYYTTVSAEIDDILFASDLLVTQSLGNSGYADGRPEAWAKNVVSVGGTIHQNTLSLDDDCWCGAASIGPAADGRIKPDFTHFYDDILAPAGACDTCYGQFGGSSAATPIVGGCFGLMFQMWSDGLFGNPVDPQGDVFDNRPHMTTAKALLINTARQYRFTGPAHDLTRVHQGWGLPDLQRLYDGRDGLYIIDETDVLAPLAVAEHTVVAAPGTPALQATLCYADPAGLPSAHFARVNDLTLQVTSPGGVAYYGNVGLRDGNWSVSGGTPDVRDTVECVFIADPAPGVWRIAVRADEINVDAHLETPALDADYALVVSGVSAPAVPGDCDGNGLLDAGDIAMVMDCIGGPGVVVDDACTCAAIDADDDADLIDISALQVVFSAAGGVTAP
jgi:serine protease AprX